MEAKEKISVLTGIKFLILALATVTVSRDTLAEDAPSTKLASLSGSYKSIKAEDWGRGTFGRREFTFDEGKWTLKFTLALDSEMKVPVFEFRTFGTYKVLDKSKIVPNTYNALFLEDKKFVTLRTGDPHLVKNFGLADCGLQNDVEKDISITGCAGWKPVAICHEDHDLLSLDKNGNLYFGLRPADNDMCTPEKRPTKLIYPVVKH
ncbi:MAG: hypothetical protein K2X47_12270 [Bdellovibrionales bacterium]|nr:hypothetical protein [Bdellovibrionales bacterium]